MLEDDRRATHTDGVLCVCSDKEKVSDDPLPVACVLMTLYHVIDPLPISFQTGSC